MALNATVQKNPADEKEEDPIRTMQKDIAMLQRGEYKPRHFVAPKPVLQRPPTNIWETKEDEQNAFQRLEQSEFKPAEEPAKKNVDEPPTLAEIGAQLAKKRTSQQIEPLPQETPAQEMAAAPEEPQKSLPASELKNIPEIDILGLENFTAYASPEHENTAQIQNLPSIPNIKDRIEYDTEKNTEFISPPAIQAEEKKGSQNLLTGITKKEDEHDILGLDQNNTGSNLISYPDEVFGVAPAEELPAKETQTEKRFKLPSVSKKILLVGVILLAGVSAAAGGYLLLKSQNKPSNITPPPPPAQTPPPPPIAPEPPATPQSAIPTSSDFTLNAENINEIRLQLIGSLSDLSQPNNLTRILMKLENTNETRYLNFEEILSVLNLILPTELKNNFDFSNATLFTYGQAEGTRLGFAVRINDKNNTIQSAAAWEPSAYEDAGIMLSYLGIAQVPEEIAFFDNIRGEITVRYLNLLSPNLTIDYAVTDTLFIFTTSRESMFAALESIGK